MRIIEILELQSLKNLKKIAHNRFPLNQELQNLGKKALIFNLAKALSQEKNFFACILNLTERQRQFLNFIAAHMNELTNQDIIQLFCNGNKSEFEQLKEQLLDLGLIFLTPSHCEITFAGEIFIPQEYFQHIMVPEFLLRSYRPTLFRESEKQLRGFSMDWLHNPDPPKKKRELVNFIVQKTLDPQNLQALVKELPPLEKMVIDGMVALGGQCIIHDLEKWVESRIRVKKYLFNETIEKLIWRTGFLFIDDHFDRIYPHKRTRSLFIPRELYELLSERIEGVNLLQESMDKYYITVKNETLEQKRPDELPLDFLLFLGAISWLTPDTYRGKGFKKAFNDQCKKYFKVDDSSYYINFLALYALKKNYIHIENDKWVLTRPFKILEDSYIKLHSDICNFWLVYLENLDFTSPILPEISKAKPYTKNKLRFLELLPEGTPLDVRKVFEVYRDLIPLFPQYYHVQYFKHYLTVDRTFEYQFFFNNFLKALSWLRLVDLKTIELPAPVNKFPPPLFKEDDDKTRGGVFQITPLGKYYLSEESSPYPQHLFQPIEVESFIVQPNFEIYISGLLPPADMMTLILFAQPKSIDKISVFKLSFQTVLRGLDAGLTLNDFQNLLLRYNKTTLPQNIEYFLQNLRDRQGEVIVDTHNCILLSKDAMLIKEIYTSKRLDEFFAGMLNEREIKILEEVDFHRLIFELRKLGYCALFAD